MEGSRAGPRPQELCRVAVPLQACARTSSTALLGAASLDVAAGSNRFAAQVATGLSQRDHSLHAANSGSARMMKSIDCTKALAALRDISLEIGNAKTITMSDEGRPTKSRRIQIGVQSRVSSAGAPSPIVVPALDLGNLAAAASAAKTCSAIRASDTDHPFQSEVTPSPCMMSSVARKVKESNSNDRVVISLDELIADEGRPSKLQNIEIGVQSPKQSTGFTRATTSAASGSRAVDSRVVFEAADRRLQRRERRDLPNFSFQCTKIRVRHKSKQKGLSSVRLQTIRRMLHPMIFTLLHHPTLHSIPLLSICHRMPHNGFPQSSFEIMIFRARFRLLSIFVPLISRCSNILPHT